MKSKIPGVYTSFKGNFTLISGSGQLESGQIYYQYPNKIRIKLADKKLIITDGKFLWMCNPAHAICAKQDVGGTSGGIAALLKNYICSKQGNSYLFESNHESKELKKIIINVDKGMLKSVKFSTEKGTYTANFLNLTVGVGLKNSLFYYKEANTQIFENPLNN